MRTISIIHPTRRPQQAFDTCFRWLFNADMKHVLEYIVAVDDTDFNDYHTFKKNIDYDGLQIFRSNSKNAIQAINNAAQVARGDLFVVVSDDFNCPNAWDTLLVNELFGKEDFLLKTDDGLQPTLVTLPILDRKYYDRFGYIYYPSYSHMWSDTEMTAVALMTGRYLKSDLKFPHDHYSTGRSQKDEVNVKADATWHQGEELFKTRLRFNFGIEKPLIPYTEIKWR